MKTLACLLVAILSSVWLEMAQPFEDPAILRGYANGNFPDATPAQSVSA